VTTSSFRLKSSVAVGVATVWLAALAPAYGQTPARPQAPATTAAKPYTPPRTADGQPQINPGVFNRRGVGGLDNGALEEKSHRPPNPLDPTAENPLSVSARPDGLNNVDRGFLDQFSEGLKGGAGAALTGDDQPPVPRGQRRQLMGIAEPNRVLPWKPEMDAARRAFLLKTNPAQGLKYVEMDARCAMPGLFFGNGPFQFMQTQGEVVILSEYQHFSRFVHLDGRPHLPKAIKMFMGDSIGHWEGNTLVVDTTNYNGVTAYSREIPYLTDALHTVERFTLTDAKTIEYEVMIDDPNQFSKPWKVTGQYNKADDLPELLEYACAEGTQTLRNILGDLPKKEGTAF